MSSSSHRYALLLSPGGLTAPPQQAAAASPLPLCMQIRSHSARFSRYDEMIDPSCQLNPAYQLNPTQALEAAQATESCSRPLDPLLSARHRHVARRGRLKLRHRRGNLRLGCLAQLRHRRRDGLLLRRRRHCLRLGSGGSVQVRPPDGAHLPGVGGRHACGAAKGDEGDARVRARRRVAPVRARCTVSETSARAAATYWSP